MKLFQMVSVTQMRYQKIFHRHAEPILVPKSKFWLFHHFFIKTSRWRVKPWRQCSRTCGGGLKTREVYCVRVHSNIKEPVRVENKHCRAEDKPAQHEENCNTTVCPPQWKESSWGSVSNTRKYYTGTISSGLDGNIDIAPLLINICLSLHPSLVKKIN